MKCKHCERRLFKNLPATTKAKCGHPDYELCDFGDGLGDWVGKQLNRVGIKATPNCGCEKRKQWLNRVGEKIKEITYG